MDCTSHRRNCKEIVRGLCNYLNINFNDTEKPKSLDEVAQEVIQGKYGNGATRKKKLTEEGYDYDKVQKRVNELMKNSPNKAKKSLDTIAQEVIRGDWGNGATRKKKLTEEGYDYDLVQKRVNELLGE